MTLLARDGELWDAVFKESAARARFVERKLGKPGAEVLDVGCATGALCALLRERGLQSVGVDINHRFVAAARTKDPDGRYFVADMRTLSLRRKFDAVLCLGTTLAYNLTNEDVLGTLTAFRRHLKVGGLVIVDVLNAMAFTGPRPFLRRTQHAFSVRGRTLSATIEHRLNAQQQTMTEQVTWRGRMGGRAWVKRDAAEAMRLFFPQELALFLSSAGFSSVELTDRYANPSAGFGGRRLIALARVTAP